ncbi:MAG TPA: M1 family aminopeptidase [Gemmatimonadaceae bacterium]|nr:M1 family aminopeptidase [Gemmatimonadaceae bacterium]
MSSMHPLPRVLALLLLAAAPAAAQSNAERMANDSYTRSHNYNLIHQRIELADFNWDSTSLTGHVATTLVSLKAGLDSIVLDAGSLLRITQVRDSKGALRSASHGDTLVVYLRSPATFRDTVRFAIAYTARIDNGHGLTFIKADGRPHRPQQIWSQGEDHNNHDWFPTYDFPNDKMTWELMATVPAEYTVVSNGRLVKTTSDHKRGTRTFDWRQDKPSATYLVSLVVAPLAKIHDSWHGKPVDYYVYHSDSARARRVFSVTPDMIDVYSKLTGVPYPWAKYAQTTVADFFGGMENVSATTLVDWLPDSTAYQDRPWYQWLLIPHELAHQWFGDYATTENWANMWLNEGFAEFMPGQYWYTTLGSHAAQDYYADEYRQFMNIEAERSMPLASLGSNNIYPKGALVLRMLEHYLGRQRFWAAVHLYLVRHAFGNATTEGFREAVLDATGQNLDWFFDEWLYDTGYPAFAVAAKYDSAAQRLTLTVRQTQTDSLKPDSTGFRYDRPLIFRMPVTVRVGTTAGDVVAHALLDKRTQTIAIDHVTSAPTMVIFDDGNGILKSLHFPEPTSWLATQLGQDPDLWNRAWVIAQLSSRTRDSLAARSLAHAATGADYDLTRAQAAAALGHFPTGLALSTLAAAMHDTSSRVRSAAVASLGAIGGTRAVTLAQNAFDHDPSYQVRTAALVAVARAGTSAQQHAVLARGLTTPSYRDAIQGAALFMISRGNDTTFTSQLEAMLGARADVAGVLGIFASHGDSTALDVLMRHLDDQRSYVRQWVLASCAARLTPSLALARLRSLSDRLKYSDTRKAVADLVGKLEKERTSGSK